MSKKNTQAETSAPAATEADAMLTDGEIFAPATTEQPEENIPAMSEGVAASSLQFPPVLPFLEITYGVGRHSKEHVPGTLVLGDTPLSTLKEPKAVTFTIIASADGYTEVLPKAARDAGMKPRRFRNEAELREAGLTSEFTDDPSGATDPKTGRPARIKPSADPFITFLVLAEAPAGSDEVTLLEFPLAVEVEIDGKKLIKHYAVGKLTFKGFYNYKKVYQKSLRTKLDLMAAKGTPSYAISFKVSVEVQTFGTDPVPCFKVVPHGSTPEPVKELAHQAFLLASGNSVLTEGGDEE